MCGPRGIYTTASTAGYSTAQCTPLNKKLYMRRVLYCTVSIIPEESKSKPHPDTEPHRANTNPSISKPTLPPPSLPHRHLYNPRKTNRRSNRALPCTVQYSMIFKTAIISYQSHPHLHTKLSQKYYISRSVSKTIIFPFSPLSSSPFLYNLVTPEIPTSHTYPPYPNLVY